MGWYPFVAVVCVTSFVFDKKLGVANVMVVAGGSVVVGFVTSVVELILGLVLLVMKLMGCGVGFGLVTNRIFSFEGSASYSVVKVGSKCSVVVSRC